MIRSFIIRNLKLLFHKRRWRELNRHNDTAPTNIFDVNKVTVGNFSYGSLCVLAWGHPQEKLRIGHYVSIASGVTFILGGNHYSTGMTTFPLSAKKGLDANIDAGCRGPIIIDDDVWIGANVTVLSGVTIGRGAIIGAGSVVSKNVGEYEVVGGNPATFIKMRIPEESINYARIIDFSKLDIMNIAKVDVPLFYEKPDEEINEKLKKYWS